MSNVKDVFGLLPEAYFDLIARMVPGAIVTMVFAIEPCVNENIKTVKPFVGEAGLIIVMLLAAYAFGLVIDVVGDLVVEVVVWITNRSDIVQISAGNKLFEIAAENAEFYPVFLKMVAESVALRSFFLLTLLTIFIPLPLADMVPLWGKVAALAVLLGAFVRLRQTIESRTKIIVSQNVSPGTDAKGEN